MSATRAMLLAMSLGLFCSPAQADDATQQPAAKAAPQLDPLAEQISRTIAAIPPATTDPEKKDQAAMAGFYSERAFAGLWVTPAGANAKAGALVAELRNADAYGLASADFATPNLTTLATPDKQAAAELQLTTALLTYARHARGGRIADPAAMLTTNIDRRPQWLDPVTVLAAAAQADDIARYLRSLHPRHEQFERLRNFYVAELDKAHGKGLSKNAKRLRANMEMWRWMPDDLGSLYVFNNIPEFMQYVVKDGEIIRTERIVAGQLDKQSAVFSRPLKYVVLRPLWRVPESIKVNEVWPGLIRGGGIMQKYGMQVETKDGAVVDWHKIDWVKTDIRDYEVTQPPGPLSVLGHVKFSFPSQHTIYMHDTPDKWMFNKAQRTLSHGCLRVRNPMDLARIVLKEDKGWDADKIAELDSSGPRNNEIAIDKRIPIHLTYFTVWVDDSGKLRSFADIYGHEKRVVQALDGQWDKIDHGKDHLAPVEVAFDPAAVAAKARARSEAAPDTVASFDPFGLGW